MTAIPKIGVNLRHIPISINKILCRVTYLVITKGAEKTVSLVYCVKCSTKRKKQINKNRSHSLVLVMSSLVIIAMQGVKFNT